MSGIYIYGRGVKGLEAFFCLRDKGIKVECIIDNDESKQGPVVAGVKCLSYQEFLKIGDRASLIIVSNKKSKGIIHTLHKDGYKNVETWERCAKQYEEALAVLENLDKAKFYLDKVKQADWNKNDKEMPLFNNLIQDMEFRDGLK